MYSAIKRYFCKRDLLLEKAFKILNGVKINKFCCWFTLQQGTIFIAIVDLSLTSFCLFLLFLSAIHAQDILCLVKRDLEQLEEFITPEGNAAESQTLMNNERKMLLGQHLALIVMFLVWTGVVMISIHFISSVLLLYGAIQRVANFLLPWASTSLFSLITTFFFLVMIVSLPLPGCKLVTFLVLSFTNSIQIYSWLIVFSYYQELKKWQFKGPGGVIHSISDTEKGLGTTQFIQTLKSHYRI